jgi:mono/diheme cytochrome c family protein
MKLAFGLAVCTLLMGAVLWAQADKTDFAEYQGWMKSNAATVADLNKNLTAKDAAASQTNVRKLQENLAMVMAYWQSRNVNDGVRFALDATYGLAQVGVLASQGKFDDAAAALKTAQGNCAGCHMAHRDKAPDGSFKIKLK